MPPLVIYKQAPRPETPPPLVIRERPPTPPHQPCEPLVIERRIPAEPQPRKIIIEHLPTPPPKPRDIILEKWLPKECLPRTVYVQKAATSPRFVTAALNGSSSYHQYQPSQSQSGAYAKSYYEIVDPKQKQELYEVMDRSRAGGSGAGKRIIRHLVKPRRSTSNELSYSPSSQQQPIYSPVNFIQQQQQHHALVCQQQQPDIYCLPHQQQQQQQLLQQQKKPKVTGYRIIRQIIPGPNATAADIEKALARSQRISSTYANSKRIYSPSFETNNQPIYSASNSTASPAFGHPPPVTVMQTGSKPNHRTVFVQQAAYSPHNIYAMKETAPPPPPPPPGMHKKEVYRSSSIDNFL